MEQVKMKAFARCVLLAAGLVVLAAPVRADCSAALDGLRRRVVEVKDEARRLELAKLIEKAEKDEKNGRAKLCAEAVSRADMLLK
jgi:hypothetical protein